MRMDPMREALHEGAEVGEGQAGGEDYPGGI